MVPTLVLVSWFAQFKIYTVNVQALMYILTFWFSDYFKTPGHYFHCFLITPVLKKKNFPHLFYLFKTPCHKNRLYQVLLNLALRKSQETSFFLNNVSVMYRNNLKKKEIIRLLHNTGFIGKDYRVSYFFFTVTCLIYQNQPINEQTKCSLFWWFNKD